MWQEMGASMTLYLNYICKNIWRPLKLLQWFFFFCLSNDIRIEDCRTWSGWVIDKWWNGDLEVSSHGLIEVLSWKFTKGTASSDKNLNHDIQCHNLSAECYRVSHGSTIGILNGNVWGREKGNSGEVKLPPRLIQQHGVRTYGRAEV